VRSGLTTRIKDAMFAVFGESQLDSINTNSPPQEVATWKASSKTRLCYRKLFRSINTLEDSGETHMQKILSKLWPSEMPSNIKVAYAISVCQIMLSSHYERLIMSEEIVKNRLKKNLVNNFLIFLYVISNIRNIANYFL
jgi:hypothetical protein